MERIVKLEGTEIGLKASAGTVRAYRDMFGRDLIADMVKLEQEIVSSKTLGTESTGIAEMCAWTMAHEYDPSIPELKEWLDRFSPYFVYTALISIINMWNENCKTLTKTRKK